MSQDIQENLGPGTLLGMDSWDILVCPRISHLGYYTAFMAGTFRNVLGHGGPRTLEPYTAYTAESLRHPESHGMSQQVLSCKG